MPSVEATCVECGFVGRAGGELMPYNFAKGDTRWLCAVSMPRQCLKLSWEKFKANENQNRQA